MKKIAIFTSLIILTILLSSCASKEIEHRERSDEFIADINPFEIGVFHLYTTVNLKKPKVSDLTVTFAPRTNTIFVYGRVGLDVIRVGFPYDERLSINKAREEYLEQYTNSTIPNIRPNKKNAYSKGQAKIEWGLAGASHEVYTTYMTNAQYLELNKPYFRIYFDSKEEAGKEQVYSPRLSIYISPAQWEQILEACNQDRLVQMTDEILAQAEAF